MTGSNFYGTLLCSRRLTDEEASKVNEILGGETMAHGGSEEIEVTDCYGHADDMINTFQEVVDYLCEAAGVVVAGELEFEGTYDGSSGTLSIDDGNVGYKNMLEDFSDEELQAELDRRAAARRKKK